MMETPEQKGHDYGKPLRDRTAIVTGSSSGIGAGIAKALARAGARVVVNYASSRDGAEQVLREIEKEGGQWPCCPG